MSFPLPRGHRSVYSAVACIVCVFTRPRQHLQRMREDGLEDGAGEMVSENANWIRCCQNVAFEYGVSDWSDSVTDKVSENGIRAECYKMVFEHGIRKWCWNMVLQYGRDNGIRTVQQNRVKERCQCVVKGNNVTMYLNMASENSENMVSGYGQLTVLQ